ncbi:MAG: hypothetical protein ACOYYJ_16375 [Chloroflexota bacterium]
MNKLLNKWFRQFHRWMAVPTAIMIPIAIVIKFSGNLSWEAILKPYEMVQSVLMLALAVTGSYLYLLPYLVKWKRQRAQAT